MAGSTPASPIAELAVGPVVVRARRTSLGREAWRRFRRHRLALISAGILSLIILALLLGPTVWPVPINAIDFSAQMQGPSLAHPLGTDDLGQDLLARMIYGGRISMAVGITAMLVAVLVGVFIGAVAGTARGSIDMALMWVCDLFLSLPQLPLLLLIIYLFQDSLRQMVGQQLGTFILIVAVIGGFRWMSIARLVRAQFFSLREKEFVEAARALGASTLRQVAHHILPNAIGPVIVAGTIEVANAIIAESTLSFLGLGFPPDIPSWGRILYDAKDYLDSAPHWALFAGGAIFFTVMAINYIGDGLRDALDPRRVIWRPRRSRGRGAARNSRAQDAFQDRRRHGASGRRCRSDDRARRNPERRRRVGMRQDRHGDDHPQADRDAAGQDRRGQHPVERPRSRPARRGRDAAHPQPRNRDHLSGADDVAEPGLHGRRPDRRGRAPARAPQPARGDGPGYRDAAPRPRPGAGTAGARLPAPALGRYASAGDDRDGDRLQPGTPDRRRADHRARRDDPGADPRPVGRDEVALRHGDHADHPRNGCRRRDRAAGRGDVCRSRDRGGAGCRAVRASAAPLHPGADPLDPAARLDQRQKASARSDHRHRAKPSGAAARLPLRAALQIRQRRVHRGGARAAHDRG